MYPVHTPCFRCAGDEAMLRRNLVEVQGVAAGLIVGIEEAELNE